MGGDDGWRDKFRHFAGKVVDCVLPSKPPQETPAPGVAAERLAEAHLSGHGARLLARNARCKGGEIDLIVEHAGCIVFVEVRLRHGQAWGGAGASITPAKQHRLQRAAAHWLAHRGVRYRHLPCRFDAVLLDALAPARLTWIQSAFEARPA